MDDVGIATGPLGILDDLTGSATTIDLPPILPNFFVPPLADKPQNPIMDTLRLASEARQKPAYLEQLPHELGILALDSLREKISVRSPSPTRDIWRDALVQSLGIRNKALSWDRLRPTHPSSVSSTGFLSEQENQVFAAAQYHSKIRHDDPLGDAIHVPQATLLNALKLTVLGTSSVFHSWDSYSERFVRAGEPRGPLLVDGRDEVISQSLTARFLTIGTLLRRLEVFLEMIKTRFVREGPIVHAFVHALSTVVTHLRFALSRCPPNKDSSREDTLTATWIHYEIYEQALVALGELCGREETRLPQDYIPFNPSPASLLSKLYAHLDSHITRQSRRLVRVLSAFLLTRVSDEYLQQLSQSVGYAISVQPVILPSNNNGRHFMEDDEGGEREEVGLLEMLESPNAFWTSFPDFFSQPLVDNLRAAQKSLLLLQAAKPDHPLLQRTSDREPVKCFWTARQIENAWNGGIVYRNSGDDRIPSPLPGVNEQPPENAADGNLAIFQVFDLEPGSNLSSASTTGMNALGELQTFIDSFPDALPPITPTLSHITSLVLRPLVDHASNLSSALLALFLSHSIKLSPGEPVANADDNLNFTSHLHLLRSYLMLTSASFKSRLSAALFSDSESWESESDKSHAHSISMSIRSVRRKSMKGLSVKDDGEPGQDVERPWAVGLAPSLLERETWPPVGADLSFFLRTVIVDSFGREGDSTGRLAVIEEAEWRLGFAIRDLPVGTGKEKWLDPLSIEALDFLYMDYRPPRSLQVLISPDILSKYQRTFAFLLRLMRVEHAVRSLFRMTQAHSNPLFPTLATPRKQLLHFRFVVHSFVSTLSSYVYDTAIGGNFDPFVVRLSEYRSSELNSPRRTREPGFSDVFALAKSHSEMLDGILSACLLRSNQRGAGELLRRALELVLDFCIIAGELFRGRMEEYQAAEAMREVELRFFGKMATLMKVLRGTVDEHRSPVSVVTSPKGNEGGRRPTGGQEALYHLYIRLDLGKWWSTGNKRG